MKKNEIDYLLYAVTDFPSYPQRDPLESVRKAIRGGATIIQLREKHLTTAEIVRKALPLRDLCRASGVCFIIDDDVEAALLCDADGVHVGQHDQELGDARKRLGPEKLIGVSAQTVEQAVAACAGGADYLGVGAVFPTTTKADADAVSHETLQAICAASNVPVVAIGGIGLANMDQLAGSGIRGISVVSAIFGADDEESAARRLKEKARKLFGSAMPFTPRRS